MDNNNNEVISSEEFQRITEEKYYRAVKEESKPLFAWFSLT